MVTADARNSRRFNLSFPCHTEGIMHRHASPLSLYTPMPYSQAYDHSITDGLTKTMLLIGTPLVVKYWRNFIHSWRSSRCHSWSHCGPHFLPLFGKWCIQFKKYCSGGMTCATWLSFPINNSRVSVLMFIEDNASFMSVVQDVCFSSGRNTLREWVFMSHHRHFLCSDSCPSSTSFHKGERIVLFQGLWWM